MQETGTLTVGRFSFDLATGEISGPADYVRERLAEYVREVEVGRHGWLTAFAPEGQRIELTILVGIQTDYAGWIGSRRLFAAMDASREVAEELGS